LNQKEYEIIIGLEVHVQLNTKTKIFCGDQNTFGKLPNRHTSSISLAHPGTLPRVNKEAIRKGIALALSLGAEINRENRFDRKHYFYPDLPKAYQITQDKLPICVGGSIDIPTNDGSRTIRFHHTHMEEDAGKSIHDLDPSNSMIDLNRAGTPLLEIVTEPDMRTAQEVHDFIATLQQLVRYIGISDANMEEGSMRCDCNVSVRLKGDTQLNNRCEVKNINSKKFAMQAVAYEAQRQIKLMEKGEYIDQQTLHFDSETGKTSSTRDKEDAHDYRYFPDPDLPPIFITDDEIAEIKELMPVLPQAQKKLFISQGIKSEHAELLIQERGTVSFTNELLKSSHDTKAAVNFIINKVLPSVKDDYQDDISSYPLSVTQCATFLNLIHSGKIIHSTAYQSLYPALMSSPHADPVELCESMGLSQSHDSNLLDSLIQAVINENPNEVKKYKKGKKGLIGFFVGKVMKESRGTADPKLIQQMLTKALQS